uniref:Kruppel like factor 7b n=1 Tax=Erpetoichthys calabaricus TaxID=27687 RepID=A0A8C4SUP3_ERPCA
MDVLANYSIFQELQLVHDTGYFSALPSLEENWQQTCLELERYLQTEPKRFADPFDEDLDCLLMPSFIKGEIDDHKDPLLPSLDGSLLERPSPRELLISQDKLLSDAPLGIQTADSTTTTTTTTKEAYTAMSVGVGVNPAQLSAVTSLTPPSSPELGRHLIKPSQTFTATADGTVTLNSNWLVLWLFPGCPLRCCLFLFLGC